MCDLQAIAGEVKFSLQTTDHDGWLLADGRSLSNVDSYSPNKNGGKYATSQLKQKMASTILPDYRGHFLQTGSGVAADTTLDTVPDHTHDVIAASMSKRNGNASLNHCESGCKGSWFGAVGGNSAPIAQSTVLTTKVQTTFVGTETAPTHYVANVFVYSGKLGSAK